MYLKRTVMNALRYYSFLQGEDYQYGFTGPIEVETQDIKEWVLWVVFNTPCLSNLTHDQLQGVSTPRVYGVEPERDADPDEWDNSSEVWVDLKSGDLDNSTLLTGIKNEIVRIVLANETDFNSVTEVESSDEFQE